jgi:hypothetical protein
LALLRIGRLSVQPVGPAQFRKILTLGGETHGESAR